MCEFFDPGVPKQCLEDDAEEVTDKEKSNFCEWYKPSASAYDEMRSGSASRAESELSALFVGDEPAQPEKDSALQDVEDLFK